VQVAKATPLVVAALLLVVLLLQWLKPYPMPESSQVLQPDLPQISHLLSTDTLSLIQQRNIWTRNREPLMSESSVTADGDAAVNPSGQGADSVVETQEIWRLLGVSHEGREPLVVIDNGRTIDTYRLGETLPDGGEIVNIMPFGVELLKAGERNSVYLFGRQ
jgi:hypothetical protein